MSSLPASLTPCPLAPATHATETARNAGCLIGDVCAESDSSAELVLQSSSVQNASGSRAQSVQKRGGGGIVDGPIVAIAPMSPSPINASHAACGSAGLSSPHPSATTKLTKPAAHATLTTYFTSNLMCPLQSPPPPVPPSADCGRIVRIGAPRAIHDCENVNTISRSAPQARSATALGVSD